MNTAEQYYSTSETEALAVIFALRKSRVFLLLGNKCTILTYHKSLSYEFQMRDLDGRLARWMDFHVQYDFNMEYMP